MIKNKPKASNGRPSVTNYGGHNTAVICDHLQDNMHFSVPDTVELKDKSGSNYLVSISTVFRGVKSAEVVRDRV